MAEILIRAYNSWMEAVPQATKDKWSVAMWAKYNRRRRKGNPIVIKSNGWKWGKKECLPRYVILRVDMSMEEAKKYVEKGYEDKDGFVDLNWYSGFDEDIEVIGNIYENPELL